MSLRKCVRCGTSYEAITDNAARSYAPFCSKRCADVDLVHWLKGDYAVNDEGKLALAPDVDAEASDADATGSEDD